MYTHIYIYIYIYIYTRCCFPSQWIRKKDKVSFLFALVFQYPAHSPGARLWRQAHGSVIGIWKHVWASYHMISSARHLVPLTLTLHTRLWSVSFICVTWLNYVWHDLCESPLHVPDASDNDESYHTYAWSCYTRGGVMLHTHSWHSHQLCKFFTAQSLLKRKAQDCISNTPYPLAQPITNNSHFFLSFENPELIRPKQVTSHLLCDTVHIFNLFLFILCVKKHLATISLYVQVWTDTLKGTFTQWDVVASDRAVEPRVRGRVGTGRNSQKSDSCQIYSIKSL